MRSRLRRVKMPHSDTWLCAIKFRDIIFFVPFVFFVVRREFMG